MGLENTIENEVKYMKLYEKAIVVGDFHYPFEDKRTVKIFNTFLKDFYPEKIYLIGDIIDFYEISKFEKNPKRKTKLQDEINMGVLELKYIRTTLPNADITYFEGNHTDRLRKFLWKNPELSSLKSLELENLLELNNLNIKLIPYKKPYTYKGLYINHGNKIRKFSGQTAKVELDELANDGIIGHTHRLGAYYKTTIGKEMCFYENGCMCNLEQEYDRNPNWQQGFTVIYFDKVANNHNIQQIHIKKHKFVFNGKLYK